MAEPRSLYDKDFVRWTEEQATALRHAKSLPARGTGSSNLPLDWENLAEEIESLGKSDRRETDGLIKKQMRAAARPAADDLRQHDEPIEGIREQLEKGEYRAEHVLGDWFPEGVG